MKRYSAEWYQEVLNAMEDFLLVKGPKSRLLWANKPFLDYYGMSVQDLENLIDGEQSDPDDTLQYVQDDQVVFDTGKTLDIPSESVTNHSGQSADFHTIKSPIYSKDEVVLSVGVSRSLSQASLEKRSIDHKDAKKFTRPLRALTENFPLPMLMLDRQKRVVNSSPLWGEKFGGSSLLSNIFFPDGFPRLHKLDVCIQEVLDTQKHVGIMCNTGKNHAPQFFEFHVSPWHYSDGSMGGVTIVGSDITPLTEQKQKLKKYNEEMQHFIHTLSHDLKTPLVHISGYLTFLKEDVAEKNYQNILGYLDKMEQAIKRMHARHTTMLEITGISKSAITKKSVQLIDLIQGVLKKFQPDLDKKGVTVELDQKTQCVMTDAKILKIMLEKLLSNALVHGMDEAHPKIIISCYQSDDLFTIDIGDNGSGIPTQYHEEVFQLFRKLEARKKTEGVGLSLVKKYVELLNGSISIENLSPENSAENTGVIFSIHIPYKEEIYDEK